MNTPLQGKPEFPTQVYIETTNVCNLHCSGCPRELLINEGNDNYLDYRFLTREEFSNLVDQVAEYASNERPIRLKLFFLGEPLAHKDVVWQVAYAKQYPGLIVNLTTNGTLLRPEKTRLLLKAGIDEISVSVGGASPDYYEKVRPGTKNSLGRVIDNLYATLKLRDQFNRTAKISVTMVAIGAEWEQQFAALKIIWGGLVDVVAYRPFSDFHAQSQLSSKGFCCSEPFERMFLRANGVASLCTEDVSPENVMGNWRAQRLREIWDGPAYARIRNLHRSSRYEEIGLCRRCHVPLHSWE